MHEQDPALALVGLAAAIERAIQTSLANVARAARTHDQLTARLLDRNLVQLTAVVADLRQRSTEFARDELGQSASGSPTTTVAA